MRRTRVNESAARPESSRLAFVSLASERAGRDDKAAGVAYFMLHPSSRPPSFLDHQYLGREEEKVRRLLLPDLCARTKEKYAECDV